MTRFVDQSRGSETTSNGVRVRVEPHVIPEECDPAHHAYGFSYRITITNENDVPVQLETRHWIIVDGNGGREEVRGDGVIGCQPTLEPGEYFVYTSMCPLATPWGTMEGSYRFRRQDDGRTIDVRIDRFILAAATAAPRPITT
ncbi:MAG: Co2+/Mg2+ efflux protein ApaG [Planctomycetota bacterium]